MKIAWWDYIRTNEDVFTQTTTTNRLPVFDELVRRGHDFKLVHIPRSVMLPNTSKPGVIWKPMPDTGRYKDHWLPSGYATHQVFCRLAKTLAGNDGSFRMAREIKRRVDEQIDPIYDCDVLVVKMQPMIALLTRLEMTSTILRHARANIPVIVIDGEYQFSAIRTGIQHCIALGRDPHNQGPMWDASSLHRLIQVWTPYQRRMWPNQAVMYYVYCPEKEAPLDEDADIDYTLGYVGNDYQRQEYLEKFYKSKLNDGTEVNNAIWGSWDLDKWPSLREIVGEAAFLGRVSPAQIQACYQRCAASVVITHRKYYMCGMLTQRFSEVTEAGRVLMVDSDLVGAHHLLAHPTLQRVSSAEEAHARLAQLINDNQYWDLVRDQREFMQNKKELSPSYWADGIEANVRGHGWTAQQPELPGIFD